MCSGWKGSPTADIHIPQLCAHFTARHSEVLVLRDLLLLRASLLRGTVMDLVLNIHSNSPCVSSGYLVWGFSLYWSGRGLPRWWQWSGTCLPVQETEEISARSQSGRSPGGGHGNPLQYSCLKNPRDRGAWQATIHKVTELDTTDVTEHAGKHKGDIYLDYSNYPWCWMVQPWDV